MLAEPKYKQKWAEDPRNTHWSQDTSKYGYQMLSKMGWSEGKGLGASENGVTSHVKVVKRKSNLGLGSKTDHSDNWIAHQDDFNELLTRLNQKSSKDDSSQTEKKRPSLKDSVQQSRKKIFYSKFIHSKDLSLKSKNDLACIIGQRSKSTPSTPQDLSEDEGAKSDASIASCPAEASHAESGFVTRNSEMNLQEYFAQKMARLQRKKDDSSIENKNDESNTDKKLPEEDCHQLKKKKKKSKKEKVEVVLENENSEDNGIGTPSLKEQGRNIDSEDNLQQGAQSKKKKSKKSKTGQHDGQHNENSTDNLVSITEEEKKTKNKKPKKDKRHKNSETTQTEEESNYNIKKKKKEKRKRRKEEEGDSNDVNDGGLEIVIQKKKMKK